MYVTLINTAVQYTQGIEVEDKSFNVKVRKSISNAEEVMADLVPTNKSTHTKRNKPWKVPFFPLLLVYASEGFVVKNLRLLHKACYRKPATICYLRSWGCRYVLDFDVPYCQPPYPTS